MRRAIATALVGAALAVTVFVGTQPAGAKGTPCPRISDTRVRINDTRVRVNDAQSFITPRGRVTIILAPGAQPFAPGAQPFVAEALLSFAAEAPPFVLGAVPAENGRVVFHRCSAAPR